ncbi:MAG: DUF1624 domain-containing protein [Clostridia bacterium]|nr:DUF1624 domain-containing protein [Clostridia bacterium]
MSKTAEIKKPQEKQAVKKKKSPRYAFIDALRGICVVSMIAYHTMWDLVYIFGVDAPWFKSDYAYIWQQSICWLFIFLSGFCWNFGKKHLSRGLLVFVGGAIITLVTMVAMPEDIIIFGVLTLIGSCMLICTLLDPLIKEMPPFPMFIINFAAFLLLKKVPRGYIGFGDKVFYRLPTFLYKNYITTFFGFKFDGFKSSDYFPLIPWIFLFFAGYFFFKFLKKNGIVDKWVKTEPTKEVFTTIGRNSFWIYMAHQPVVYGVLYIIFKLIK